MGLVCERTTRAEYDNSYRYLRGVTQVITHNEGGHFRFLVDKQICVNVWIEGKGIFIKSSFQSVFRS